MHTVSICILRRKLRIQIFGTISPGFKPDIIIHHLAYLRYLIEDYFQALSEEIRYSTKTLIHLCLCCGMQRCTVERLRPNKILWPASSCDLRLGNHSHNFQC